jgi:hypothetical protein
MPFSNPDYTPRDYRLIVEPTVKAEEVTPESIKWIAAWCKGTLIENGTGIHVPTLTQVKKAELGWFVYKKRSGDFDTMPGDSFGRKYILSPTQEGL